MIKTMNGPPCVCQLCRHEEIHHYIQGGIAEALESVGLYLNICDLDVAAYNYGLEGISLTIPTSSARLKKIQICRSAGEGK